MSGRFFYIVRLCRVVIAGAIAVACLLVIIGRSGLTAAQVRRQAQSTAGGSSNAELVARGRYLVEDVAICGTCHTPRSENGELDPAQQLKGAPLFLQPALPIRDWPIVAPRLAGLPPGNDAAMITLLTTGIWTNGKPLREPMPRFHMARTDAEAVLAYLKTL